MNLPRTKNTFPSSGFQQEQTSFPKVFRLRFSLPIAKLFLCLLLLSLFATPALCADRVAVIFPDLSAPYKSIFQTILDGIQSQNNFEYQLYPLPKDYDPAQLKKQLDSQNTTAIIALGKRGYLATKSLQTNLPTVLGALPLIPNGISGISLSADPDQLFSRIKSLIPNSKQVYVVYSPKINGWLMPLAEIAAEKNGLKLIALPAEDLRAAMHHYRQVLKTARGPENAIWLPLDQVTASEDVVLPMLLQEAWNKELVICSSKPTHVQRGALFSMYPDNFGLGQELAKLAETQLTSNTDPFVGPLKRLQIAVNIRTAAHLGLNFSPQQQQTFNLTFPSR